MIVCVVMICVSIAYQVYPFFQKLCALSVSPTSKYLLAVNDTAIMEDRVTVIWEFNIRR